LNANTPTFKVRVSKDYTVFAAAHFVSYDDDQVEPLHGHNYRTALSVEGDLDQANAYVYNFVPLKRALRAICDSLDHRLLLPTDNPLVKIEHTAGAYHVRSAGKVYVFPEQDVVQLPISNTTAEMLARWIGAEMEARLRATAGLRPGLIALEVEVEESFGQRAYCRWPLGA
jgi:6-pyruvoyltetrahydropterin/6-carboxytetrahydropterin synthase